MALKAIVIADHNTRTAKLSFIDDDNNFTPTDFRGQELKDMTFPYSHLQEYDFLFDKLGFDSSGLEVYHFTAIGFS